MRMIQVLGLAALLALGGAGCTDVNPFFEGDALENPTDGGTVDQEKMDDAEVVSVDLDNADMTTDMAGDLSRAPDLVAVQDLAVPPDFTVLRDLAMPPQAFNSCEEVARHNLPNGVYTVRNLRVLCNTEDIGGKRGAAVVVRCMPKDGCKAVGDNAPVVNYDWTAEDHGQVSDSQSFAAVKTLKSMFDEGGEHIIRYLNTNTGEVAYMVFPLNQNTRPWFGGGGRFESAKIAAMAINSVGQHSAHQLRICWAPGALNRSVQGAMGLTLFPGLVSCEPAPNADNVCDYGSWTCQAFWKPNGDSTACTGLPNRSAGWGAQPYEMQIMVRQ